MTAPTPTPLPEFDRHLLAPAPTWTPALRRATAVIYATTAILLLLFPLSLVSWLDDKDFSTIPVVRRVVAPMAEAIGTLGPAGWNAAVRERAKDFMRRSD